MLPAQYRQTYPQSQHVSSDAHKGLRAMSGPVMDVADILQAQRKRFLERYQEGLMSVH
jgi:hypothetical protein